jgi:hypothetical protein
MSNTESSFAESSGSLVLPAVLIDDAPDADADVPSPSPVSPVPATVLDGAVTAVPSARPFSPPPPQPTTPIAPATIAIPLHMCRLYISGVLHEAVEVPARSHVV